MLAPQAAVHVRVDGHVFLNEKSFAFDDDLDLGFQPTDTHTHYSNSVYANTWHNKVVTGAPENDYGRDVPQAVLNKTVLIRVCSVNFVMFDLQL